MTALTTVKSLTCLSNSSLSLPILKTMYFTRFVDQKMAKLVRQNKGVAFQLSTTGHEMIGAVCAHEMISKKDWAYPYYRDRAFAIGLGCSLDEILGAFLARDVPNHSGGRMMPDHFVQKSLNIACQSSVVGSQFLQAAGTAKALQLQKQDAVVYVSAGDGATSQGDFHEALNFSSLHKLPVIFVIQDNGWAISVPVKDQTAGGSIVPMAKSFAGMGVFDIDGCDYLQCAGAMQEATQKARKGEGPSVIVAKVPRIAPHSSSDDPKKYKTEQAIKEELARDPITKFETWLIQNNHATDEQLKKLQEECLELVEQAAKKAEQYPFAKKETATEKVFKEYEVEEIQEVISEEKIVMMDAINHGLKEEMRRDSQVIVFGQDVEDGKGGVFGITRGLSIEFGKDRCFNSTLAESTIVGVAIGMSVADYKPVIEIQFTDYMWTGVNQLFNELASYYYRSNGQFHCPVVIRMPYGGYIQGGPYHSQSTEGYLAHCPGLKIVIPSNAADAKRLLKAAIRDPNPVIFLEHKAIYRQRSFAAQQEPSEKAILPFGKAHIVREGEDVTVVSWGMTVMMALEAQEQLKKQNLSVEVIDLRTLQPLDLETIVQSLKKTGKLLILHEASKNCGLGGEISAKVTEEAFQYLDAPIFRLAGKDCPVPYCKDLEEAVLPQKEDVEKALMYLSSY